MNIKEINFENIIDISTMGGVVEFSIKTKSPNTLIRVSDGAIHNNPLDVLVGAEWVNIVRVTNCYKVVIYGDVEEILYTGQHPNTVSMCINCDTLTDVMCINNKMPYIRVKERSTSLRKIYCYGNDLSQQEMNNLFGSLPQKEPSKDCRIFIKSKNNSNPGTETCNTQIATQRGWRVMDYNANDLMSFDICYETKN